MSRARDLADAGSKANFLDNVSADIDTTYAPKASPAFTGTVTIPDGGTIGSASANNAITISSGGNVSLVGSLTSGTIGSSVNFPAIGQLVHWNGYAGNNSTTTYTMDGSSTYTVIVNGRNSASPYFPVNLTFSINSSNGTISSKTDSWGTRLDESFNNTTKVLTITNHNSTELMTLLIFKSS